jgi:aminoglycoside phosphotransferase (APT) family kinase protein
MILDDEWFVILGDARRPVLRVSTLAGRGWVVKQASPLDLTRVRLLDREASLHDLATRDAWARPLKALLPRMRAYDPGIHALIVELIAYDTGWDHLRRASVKAETLGRLLGRAFASIHVAVSRTAMPTALLASQLPWILQLEHTDASDIDQAAMRLLLDLIDEEPTLGTALRRIADDWQVQTFIHGDAKLDNVLVRMNRAPRLWLIDWAFACEGDPAWDVGSVIRSCLLLWIFGIAFRRDEPLHAAAERSVFPLTLVREFTTSFLTTYLNARGLAGDAVQPFLLRAFRYAGAAMVQSALADARSRERFTLRQLSMLQMSTSMMERPDQACREFHDAR